MVSVTPRLTESPDKRRNCFSGAGHGFEEAIAEVVGAFVEGGLFVVYGVSDVCDHTDGQAPGDAKGEKGGGLHLDGEDALLRVFGELLLGFAVGRVGSPNRAA